MYTVKQSHKIILQHFFPNISSFDTRKLLNADIKNVTLTNYYLCNEVFYENFKKLEDYLRDNFDVPDILWDISDGKLILNFMPLKLVQTTPDDNTFLFFEDLSIPNYLSSSINDYFDNFNLEFKGINALTGHIYFYSNALKKLCDDTREDLKKRIMCFSEVSYEDRRTFIEDVL